MINPKTKSWLEAYTRRPKGVLLIDTFDDVENGMRIVDQLHTKLSDKDNPLIIVSEPEKSSLGIDAVRALQHSFSLKSTSGVVWRIAVIKNADILTTDAQNALLKLMEELPNRTLLLLVCKHAEDLLPTVKSRSFKLAVLPITKDQAIEYATTRNIPADTASTLYTLAEGKWSLFQSLIVDKEHVLHSHIKLIKKFVSASVFERQQILKEVSKTDSASNDFMSLLELTVKAAMHNAVNDVQLRAWKERLRIVLHAKKQMQERVSPKLVLLSLSIQLR